MNTAPPSWTRRLTAVVFPWSSPTQSSGTTWLLHTLLWCGILAGLWQLNRHLGLERWLHSPWPIVHRAWLLLFAGLVYLLGVLAAGLWHALARVGHEHAAPDLDATWHEAQQFLDRTCFNAKHLPLYLILGPLTIEIKAWLEAIAASSVLTRSATPLHIFANTDAIFVVCSSASLLGVNDAEPDAAMVLDRLRHVCQLLERGRLPQRLLQGIVVAVPFQALQSDVLLQQSIRPCQRDLHAVRQATGLECPLYVAFTGLTGSAEIAAQGWFQRFPLATDLDPYEIAAMFVRRLEHLFERQLQQIVRANMQLDLSSAPGAVMSDMLRANIRHYQFLTTATAWRPRLQRLLTEATRLDAQEPGLVAGCYFLPSGAAAKPDTTVFHALMADMLTYRDAVAWTPETLADLRRDERLTQNGYGLVLAGWLGLVFAVGWYVSGRP